VAGTSLVTYVHSVAGTSLVTYVHSVAGTSLVTHQSDAGVISSCCPSTEKQRCSSAGEEVNGCADNDTTLNVSRSAVKQIKVDPVNAARTKVRLT